MFLKIKEDLDTYYPGSGLKVKPVPRIHQGFRFCPHFLMTQLPVPLDAELGLPLVFPGSPGLLRREARRRHRTGSPLPLCLWHFPMPLSCFPLPHAF